MGVAVNQEAGQIVAILRFPTRSYNVNNIRMGCDSSQKASGESTDAYRERRDSKSNADPYEF